MSLPLPDARADIAGIRAASRLMVRELGLMSRTVAGTDLSSSGVHAVIEIGHDDGLSARDLAARLRLEKSTISRLVRTLVERGDIREGQGSADGRIKTLHLTEAGRRRLAAIDAWADTRVAEALARLDPDRRRTLPAALRDYAEALAQAAGQAAPRRAVISRGYAPGLPARLIELMTRHMHAHVHFGRAFEVRLMRDLADFFDRLPRARAATWRAEVGGHIAGGITIDGEDLGNGLAHLRWFVLDPTMRGQGLGADLLDAALRYCDEGAFPETHLWTVRGLDAARRLYERRGFRLAEEWQGDQWGAEVIEQRFVRALGG